MELTTEQLEEIRIWAHPEGHEARVIPEYIKKRVDALLDHIAALQGELTALQRPPDPAACNDPDVAANPSPVQSLDDLLNPPRKTMSSTDLEIGERLAEIRQDYEICRIHGIWPVPDLFGEIDALRAERDELRKQLDEACIGDMFFEREEQLRADKKRLDWLVHEINELSSDPLRDIFGMNTEGMRSLWK